MRTKHWTRMTALAASTLILAVRPALAGATEDPPNTHNMLVVGKQDVFLSHLPMFAGLSEDKTDYISPHRFQVILEASFSRDGENVTDTYVHDREANPNASMYTLEPTPFVLARL